jgi:phage terminase large subunit GpA-like protein
MIDNGEWRATEHFAGHAGFHIWAAYSLFPNATWPKLVKEFLEVKNDPVTLQTFVNTVLGETWEEEGEGVDGLDLINRVEKYGTATAPAGAMVITCGVDIQADRLEYELVAWGSGEESWSLDYEKIPGDPDYPEVWERLDEIIDRRFKKPNGDVLKVNAVGVDTGFKTNAAYTYVQKRQIRRVFAMKGHAVAGKPVVSRPTKVGVGKRVRLYMIGTDSAKDTIFARLKIDTQGPGFCHFPDHYPEDYFLGLTAEEVVIRYKKGVPHREYKKIRARNEPLDCRVLAYASLVILNPKFGILAKKAEKRERQREDPPEQDGISMQDELTKPTRRSMKRKRKTNGFVKGWR